MTKKKKLKWTLPQLNGIEIAIDDWELIAAGKSDQYEHTCNLCVRYAFRGKDCRSCPVKIYTGKNSCYGTPYYDFQDTFSTIPYIAKTKKQKAAAQAELDFLKKVRAAGA